MWWCQFIDWLMFETRPSTLRNSVMANATGSDALGDDSGSGYEGDR